VQLIDIVLGILNVIVVILALFLIAIVLIQRGKGGGLAGAFGGMGGSSAFGTKTGDVFTKITVFVAIAWMVLSMIMVILTNNKNPSAWGNEPATSVSKELDRSADKSKSKPKAIEADDKPTPISPDAVLPSDLPALPDIPTPK
jgi:preprotein translocase subunit SecG